MMVIAILDYDYDYDYEYEVRCPSPGAFNPNRRWADGLPKKIAQLGNRLGGSMPVSMA